MNLNTSLPAQLPKLRFLDRFMANHAGFIAGGCFKGLFLGEKIKDVDLFFKSEEDAKAAIEHYQGNPDFSPAWQNERVAAFRDQKTGIAVECITSYTGEPDAIISEFDFTITKAFYAKNEAGEYEFNCHLKFFEHLLNRKLVIDDKVNFPLSTFNRSYRYKGYGFGLCGESKQLLIAALQGQSGANLGDFYFGID